MAAPLAGRHLTRLIVTHHHPDHIGLGGWICNQFDEPLLTTQSAFLACLNISLSPGALDAAPCREFYLRNSLYAGTTTLVSTLGHSYLKKISGLPPTFSRVVAGDTIKIGGRNFSVVSGNGHAPEQLMLFCASEKLFLSADQVSAHISPNISVGAVEPIGEPLDLYLRSLAAVAAELPHNTLVLAGHEMPFEGLHIHSAELVAHHEQRCAAIAAACQAAPRSIADLAPVVLHRVLDAHQISFAFSGTLANVNYVLRRSKLARREQLNGKAQLSSVAA